MPISELDISAIRVPENRLRPVSESGVEALAASIEERGRLLHPITVREIAADGFTHELVAGAHRLEAFRALGRKTIPAQVLDLRDYEARLLEIDDNVAATWLRPVDFVVFMAERKRVYERHHPETRRGGDRKSVDFKEENQTASFAVSAAEVWGKSPRSIWSYVKTGSALDPEAVRALQQAERRIKFDDLKALAEAPREVQRDAAARMAASDKLSGKVAVREAQGAPSEAGDPMLKLRDRILGDVRRLPKARRRELFERLWAEHADLLDETREDASE